MVKMAEKGNAVVIFAKVPDLDIAKSRIAATEGAEKAAAVYDELLEVTAATAKGCHYHVAFAGAERPGRLEQIFSSSESFFPQYGNTLGKRLENAFLHIFAKGYSAACAIGCDCPYLSAHAFLETFSALKAENDIVIGPAQDGGYYLIGMNPGNEYVFSVDGWSRPELLANTISAIKAKQGQYRLLNTLSDIDTIADYNSWKNAKQAPEVAGGGIS